MMFKFSKTLGSMTTRYIKNRHIVGYCRPASKGFHCSCACNSDGVLTTPQSSNAADKQFPAKIQSIVNDISKLTLLEVADLNQLLKKTLNIPDAPMMAMGSFTTAAMAAPADEDEQQTAGKTQTAFTVKLTKIDDAKKIQVIKEVKNLMDGFNLVQAKKFVETVPQVIKAEISKDEAEKLKQALEAVGGVVTIE